MTRREREQVAWVSKRYEPKTPEELETLCQRLLGISVVIRVDRKTGCWVPGRESAA